MRLERTGAPPLELTGEAVELIQMWIELAAQSHPLVMEKALQVACVLVCAAARANDTQRIGAAEIYYGWHREIASKIADDSGNCCPPHDCLANAIVANRSGLVEQIVDWGIMKELYRLWGDELVLNP